MTFLKNLFSNKKIWTYYDEIDSIRPLMQSFENYIYTIYEKVEIIVLILNKYHDIRNEEKGYIFDDEKNFAYVNGKKDYENYERKKAYYYKGWLNRRLKRIKKILEMDIKSSRVMHAQDETIVDIITKLKLQIGENCFNDDIEIMNKILEMLDKLEINLKKQYYAIQKAYKIENWDMETHQNIFGKEFLKLIKEEISIIFDGKNVGDNYNNYLALISSSIHNHDIPIESLLAKLINENIKKIKQNKSLENMERVACFHARPIFSTSPLFPLDIKNKETGFFVDTDPNETIAIVKNFYNIEDSDVELFKIVMPKNIFKYSLEDKNDPTALKLTTEMDKSWVFRPSSFPKLNEFYIKGLITVEKVTSL